MPQEPDIGRRWWWWWWGGEWGVCKVRGETHGSLFHLNRPDSLAGGRSGSPQGCRRRCCRWTGCWCMSVQLVAKGRAASVGLLEVLNLLQGDSLLVEAHSLQVSPIVCFLWFGWKYKELGITTDCSIRFFGPTVIPIFPVFSILSIFLMIWCWYFFVLAKLIDSKRINTVYIYFLKYRTTICLLDQHFVLVFQQVCVS